MPKEKAKTNAPHRVGILVYLVSWIVPQLIGWLAAIQLQQMFSTFFGRYWANSALLALVPGMIAAVGHYWLLRRDTGQNVRGWLWASLPGWLASTVAFRQLALMNSMMFYSPSTTLTILFTPAAIVQAVWLQRHVKNAWVWVGAALVSAWVFTIPIVNQNNFDLLLPILAALSQGAIMGMTMRQLWSTPKEKTKHDATTSTEADTTTSHERLAIPDEAPDADYDTVAAAHQERTV